VLRLSLFFASLRLNLKKARIFELKKLTETINGLNKTNKDLNKNDDFEAKPSGFIAAIVFGVISENIRITIVKIKEPKTMLALR